jgi:hypothetical protein
LARGQEEDLEPDCHSGLFFLAFNPDRQEAYFTSVVEAARIVTRKVFAVPWSGRPIRFLGTFTTAGEGLDDVRISPSGDYVAFLGLWSAKVPQGLTVVRVASEQVREWPTEQEVRAFCGQHPSLGLKVTGFHWEDGDHLVFQQTVVVNPEGVDRPGSVEAPLGHDFARERFLDVREGRVVRERAFAPTNRGLDYRKEFP